MEPRRPAVHVVDDDDILRKGLKNLMEAEGLEVAVYPSAKAILDASPKLGCAVIDLRMPEIPGVEVLEGLRQAGSEIPAVLIGAPVLVADLVKAIKLGVVDILEKPIDPLLLIDAVQIGLKANQTEIEEKLLFEKLCKRFEKLTAREHELMQLIVVGRSNKAVAREMGIAMKTVVNHRAHLMAKVGAENAPDLARLFTLYSSLCGKRSKHGKMRTPFVEKRPLMRLADFIATNLSAILSEWEAFARTSWPGVAVDPNVLRDHAEMILRATIDDMNADQTAARQISKSHGLETESGPGVNSAALRHAMDRADSGFLLSALVAEYRALRASVLRLWREAVLEPHRLDIDDLTRFNESIDQSLTEAIRGFTARSSVIANRLASIVESSDDAIITKGLDGRIISWNPAGLNFTAFFSRFHSICWIRVESPRIKEGWGSGIEFRHWAFSKLRYFRYPVWFDVPTRFC